MYKEIQDAKFKDHDPKVISWERIDSEILERQVIYTFPQPGDNIKKKKYFAVRDYEKALFYNKGELVGVLSGGIYELEKKARIKGTEIIWVNTSLFEIPWGIPQSHGLPTKDGIVIGLYGNLKLRINDVKAFLTNVAAGRREFIAHDLKMWINGLLHTSLRDIFKNYNAKGILLEEREHVINLIITKITEDFLRYGLDLESFNILGISSPEGTQQLYASEKHLSDSIANANKADLEWLLKQQKEVQNRINELKEKITAQQDLLLDNKIAKEDYESRKSQIEAFISEAESELKDIKESLNED
ncbi:MAG: hypothetical protein GF353_05710 [Candidatus Lokiarchaeota archaeon]|nr:hypothetical protein [Candidatus Lokiarchaeota archaeon]